jgi:hypothetical protein
MKKTKTELNHALHTCIFRFSKLRRKAIQLLSFILFGYFIFSAAALSQAAEPTPLALRPFSNFVEQARTPENSVVLAKRVGYSALKYSRDLTPGQAYSVYSSKPGVFAAEILLSMKGGLQKGDVVPVRGVSTETCIFGGHGAEQFLLVLDQGVPDSDIGRIYSIAGEAAGVRLVFIEKANVNPEVFVGVAQIARPELDSIWQQLREIISPSAK